jgi:hypothetical protein
MKKKVDPRIYALLRKALASKGERSSGEHSLFDISDVIKD